MRYTLMKPPNRGIVSDRSHRLNLVVFQYSKWFIFVKCSIRILYWPSIGIGIEILSEGLWLCSTTVEVSGQFCENVNQYLKI